jgi:hypothetical protein
MQYLKTTTSLLLALSLIPALAQADSLPYSSGSNSISKDRIENDPSNDDITIPMNKSELDAEISTEQAQRERSEKPIGSIEVGVSSYEPNSLQLISRISSPSSFSLVGPPQINLNGITPLGRNFNLKFGTGFLAMDRTGQIGASGQTQTDQQTAYLISFRAGAEYAPLSMATTKFRPYATAALLPTLAMTSRSSFDDGQSEFGIPIELGVGTLIHVFQSLDFNLAITSILGKVQDSNMDGLGFNAGVRVPL